VCHGHEVSILDVGYVSGRETEVLEDQPSHVHLSTAWNTLGLNLALPYKMIGLGRLTYGVARRIV
jgi:hypothetical protein